MSLVRVALDVPVATLFDYRLERATLDLVGARVLVPFGRGQRAGVILEVGGESELPAERIKKVTHVFTREPRLAADVLHLMRFASRYYHHPIGQVVMGALPQGLRRGRMGRDESPLSLTALALSADWSTIPQRSVARRRVLEHLRTHGACEPAVLRALATTSPRALKDLIAQGWVAPAEDASPVPAAKAEDPRAVAGPALIDDQEKAIRQIGATLGEFAAWLLLGITGSGKTEVYLRLIERVLSTGGQALLLVPEINLTPQLEGRVGARFPGTALVGLHSGVPEAERLRRWRAAESGWARIVIGTRLAVFTPLPYLGLIVVDEEHDASLKQQDGLRYSARDLAVLRAKERRVPVVLGSATPSLETYSSALSGRYRLTQLPNRATANTPTSLAKWRSSCRASSRSNRCRQKPCKRPARRFLPRSGGCRSPRDPNVAAKLRLPSKPRGSAGNAPGRSGCSRGIGRAVPAVGHPCRGVRIGDQHRAKAAVRAFFGVDLELDSGHVDPFLAEFDGGIQQHRSHTGAASSRLDSHAKCRHVPPPRKLKYLE